MEDDVVQLKFQFPIPPNKWMAEFSNQFPNVQLKILSMFLLSKTQGSGLFQANGIELDKFWKKFSNFYDPDKFTLIFQDKNSILVNILVDNPWVIHTLMDAQQFIIQFPVLIKNGIVAIDMIAPRNKVD
ncbi:MAG: hypothetical protein KAR20_23810, partial [Candidatus Heimdallarchaeota archaeon]|nr:hypothetical protein [Candidatus Heimdallarchaeota archaeon]